MVNYRRARVPPAAYFFTVTLRDARKSYLIAHVDLLRSVVRGVRHERPFTIEAAVILPIIFMRFGRCPSDADYSGRWRAIKARLSRALAGAGAPPARRIRAVATTVLGRLYSR